MTGNSKIKSCFSVAISITIFCLSAVSVFAQNPSITSEVDRNEITTDETLILTVRLVADETIPPLILPDLDEFVIQSKRSSSSISIINGEATAQMEYKYTLQPLESGILTIAPISALLGGQTYTTESLTIEVIQGSPTRTIQSNKQPDPMLETMLDGQDYYVEASVENKNPFIGEQTNYLFRFYRATRLLGQPTYEPPDFTGFWATEQTDQRTYDTKTAGRLYRVTELRTVLFPTIIGPASIGAATIKLPRGFFQSEMALRTKPMQLNIQQLPKGAPPNFAGSVGQFSIDANIDVTSGFVGEPVTLTVNISGSGNIENMSDPVWPDMPGWRVFDSSATVNVNVDSGDISGSRVYERIMVPSSTGVFDISPISYVYFDPSNEQYSTVISKPISMSINESRDKTNQINNFSKTAITEMLSSDIRHLKPVPDSLDKRSDDLTSKPAYWVVWSVPPAFLMILWIWQRLSILFGRKNRSTQARQNAETLLKEAKSDPLSDPYKVSSVTLTRYLEQVLDRRISGLTHKGLAELLLSRSVKRELIARVEACLTVSDNVRFSPNVSNITERKKVLDETAAVISSLEKELCI